MTDPDPDLVHCRRNKDGDDGASGVKKEKRKEEDGEVKEEKEDGVGVPSSQIRQASMKIRLPINQNWVLRNGWFWVQKKKKKYQTNQNCLISVIEVPRTSSNVVNVVNASN